MSSNQAHGEFDEEDEERLKVDRENFISIQIPIAIMCCIVYVLISLGIHQYKKKYLKAPPIHESAVATVAGIILGGIIKAVTGSAVEFDATLFFYLVLPPIIFSAGFALKRKRFFRYLHYIVLFGIVGTVVNFSLIASAAYFYQHIVHFLFGESSELAMKHAYSVSWMQALLLSSVLSASDEVSALSLVRMSDFPRLGALIFGEGVLNDALSIVLFKTLYSEYKKTETLSWQIGYDQTGAREIKSIDQSSSISVPSLAMEVSLQLLVSAIIGMFCGLLNARIFKAQPSLRHFPIHQTALVMLFGYLAYAAAEAFGVSGILTLFIAAVTQAHYAWHSLSKSAQLATRISFVAISDIAEGFAFAYVGLSTWAYASDDVNAGFAVYMLCTVIAARFLTVTSICALCKHVMRIRSFDIPMHEQLTFSLGGVVRGSICWAQVLQLRGQQVAITTTLFIVIFTTVGCGILLPLLIKPPVPLTSGKGTWIETEKEKAESEALEMREWAGMVPSPQSMVSGSFEASYAYEPVPGIRGPPPSINSIKYSKTPPRPLPSLPSRGPEGAMNMHIHTSTHTNTRHRQSDDDVSTFSTHLDRTQEEESPTSQSQSQYAPSPTHHATQLRTSLDNYDLGDTLGGYQSLALEGDRDRDRDRGRDREERHHGTLYRLWVLLDERYLKPHFGGSSTTEERSVVLRQSRNVSVLELLSLRRKYASIDLLSTIGSSGRTEGDGDEREHEREQETQAREGLALIDSDGNLMSPPLRNVATPLNLRLPLTRSQFHPRASSRSQRPISGLTDAASLFEERQKDADVDEGEGEEGDEDEDEEEGEELGALADLDPQAQTAGARSQAAAAFASTAAASAGADASSFFRFGSPQPLAIDKYDDVSVDLLYGEREEEEEGGAAWQDVLSENTHPTPINLPSRHPHSQRQLLRLSQATTVQGHHGPSTSPLPLPGTGTYSQQEQEPESELGSQSLPAKSSSSWGGFSMAFRGFGWGSGKNKEKHKDRGRESLDRLEEKDRERRDRERDPVERMLLSEIRLSLHGPDDQHDIADLALSDKEEHKGQGETEGLGFSLKQEKDKRGYGAVP